MAIRRMGLRSEVNLTDVVGQFIGIQYVGIAQNVTLNVPNDNGKGTRQETKDRIRGNLVTFSPDGKYGELKGETLVLAAVIARDLDAHRDDWFLGVLVSSPQAGDDSRTVYNLVSPEGGAAAFEAAAAWLQENALV